MEMPWDDLLKEEAKAAKENKITFMKKLGATAPSRPMRSTPKARATATKSKAQPAVAPSASSWTQVKQEEILSPDSSEVPWEMMTQDVDRRQMMDEALSQSCDTCRVGEVTLVRHRNSGSLVWKCDNPRATSTSAP